MIKIFKDLKIGEQFIRSGECWTKESDTEATRLVRQYFYQPSDIEVEVND